MLLHKTHALVVALVAATAALVFAGADGATLNPHPRLWLTPQVLADITAKQRASDPDWVSIKRDADALLSRKIPRIVVVAATNTNPVRFTTADPLPFTSGSGPLYISGATGSWSAINNNPPKPGHVATATGAKTFTIPVDATGFGAFAGQSLTTFTAGGENGDYIGYGQTGSGWSDAFLQLGLVYRITGKTEYATKALSLLDWVNTLGAAGMDSPVSQDSGRASMGATLGLAVGYDWFYDRLTAEQKAATSATLNLWNTWTIANAYAIDDPTSNYWQGHLTAAATSGYATFGENPEAQKWIDSADARWAAASKRLFSEPLVGESPMSNAAAANVGYYYGGLAVSGFNYGGNDIARYVKYMLLVKSATGRDIFATTDYAQRWARNLIYQLKPDRWKAPTYGQWTGDWSGVMTRNEPLLLAAALDGKPEGAWMQWFYEHSGDKSGSLPATNLPMVTPPVQDRLLFYRATRSSTDYRQSQPTFFYSPGGEGNVYWRSDWTDAADYAWFRATPSSYSGSHPKHAGHVDLTRGTDYLLVMSNYWKGTGDGSYGAPGMSEANAAAANTLFFWDGGEAAAANCFTQSYAYNGCQTGFGQYHPPVQKLTSTYAYAENDFATAYDYHQVPSKRTLQYFVRDFLALGQGVFVVWDRVQSTSATHTKQLRWHFSSASTPVIAGNVITSVVGKSKIVATTALPAKPTIRLVRNLGANNSPMNWRAEVQDAAPANQLLGLTVFTLNSTSAQPPAVTALAEVDTNYTGVQVATAAPRVAILPKGMSAAGDGTFTPLRTTRVRFTTTHSGAGQYLVAGLRPGTYRIERNGAALPGPTTVDDAGVLSFTSEAGAFVVSNTAAAAIVAPVPALDADRSAPAPVLNVAPAPLATAAAIPAPSPVAAAGAAGHRCAGGRFEMKADIVLAGSDSVELVGTPNAPCVINGNNHRFIVDERGTWRGRFKLSYAEVLDVGTSTLDLLGGREPGKYAYLDGGAIDIQHTTFRRSGAFNVFTGGDATITFNFNTYEEDNLVPAGGPTSDAAAWFVEQGNSTAKKYFQGNRIYRAYARLLSPNWVIGGAPGCTTTCDAQGNLFVGPRVGFELGAAGAYAAYNYVHVNFDVTPERDYWSQAGNVGPLATGSVVEHNILRAGHWVASGVHGELRFNVLAEAHGHDFVRLGNGGKIHHNILLARYPGIDTYSRGAANDAIPSVFGLFQVGNNLSFYNNTIDARNLTRSLLWVYDGAKVNSFRNNVAYRLQLSAAGCPASTTCTTAIGASDVEGFVSPPPARALYLDYNDVFYDANSPRKVTYAIGVAGKQLCDAGWGAHDLGACPNGGVDPQFRGPLPLMNGPTESESSGFPFNDEDILSGAVTVSQMLSYFRWIYAPRAGSPLVGAQDPQDGAGDIGAVQVRTLPASAPPIVTTNKRPMVYGGPSFGIKDVSVAATLAGYAADDGLPARKLSLQWSKVNGPGEVVFGDSHRGITTARFSATGVYMLRLSATDGALTSTADVRIAVGPS